MNKISIFIFILITLSQVFADEPPEKEISTEINKHIFFTWQLYDYYKKGDNSILNIGLYNYKLFENDIYLNKHNLFTDTLTVDEIRIADFMEFMKPVNDFFKLLEFIDEVTGGPYRREEEERLENRRYNILNPMEPPRR